MGYDNQKTRSVHHNYFTDLPVETGMVPTSELVHGYWCWMTPSRRSAATVCGPHRAQHGTGVAHRTELPDRTAATNLAKRVDFPPAQDGSPKSPVCPLIDDEAPPGVCRRA